MAKAPRPGPRRSGGGKKPAANASRAGGNSGKGSKDGKTFDGDGRQPASRRGAGRHGIAKTGAAGGSSKRQKRDQHRWVQTGPSWRVGVEHGIDLAHFLAGNVAGKPSIRQIKRDLEAGRCRVNGVVETFHSRTLYRHDVVEFALSQPQRNKPVTTFEPERVLLDADGVVAYAKPANLTVTPSDSGKGWNLLHLLRKDLGDLRAVHRLDADTTGVVLLARTAGMQTALEEAFREHQIEKTYLAIARGRVAETGEHRARMLLASSGKGHERWRTGTGTGSLTAHTTWERTDLVRDLASVLRVSPHTGRTHQIRVHLADLGHPLYGDRIYGDRKDPILVPRQMLHAWKLRFTHPATGERLTLTAPQPDDFTTTLEELRQVR